MRGIGPGPVFEAEWLVGSRRWQGYALRSMLVLGILAGLWMVRMGRRWSGEMSIQDQAELGQAFYVVMAMMMLALVGLAAPAATAGSICLDKARGNLLLLFATDLSDAEIVLGKLLARLLPVLGLIASAAPVMAIMTLFGGVDPALLAGSILVSLACGVFGCALALTLSIWGRKTHEVLLTTYAFGILWLLSPLMWWLVRRVLVDWLDLAWLPGESALMPYNPVVLVITPVDAFPGMAGDVLWTQMWFCALGLLASALLVGLSVWRIRAVVVRQAGRSESPRKEKAAKARRRWLPSPGLDGNPVLWREWHRRRPSRWSVAVWALFVAISAGFGLWAMERALSGSMPGSDVAGVVSGFQVVAGLLLLSVSSATSLAEERQRGSLDVLLATPMSTRSIVLAKWLAAYRGVPALAVLPVLIAGGASSNTGYLPGPFLIGGLVLAYGAGITSLGLALATWIPKMGRAIGLTVGIYLGGVVLPIPLGMIFFGDGPNRAGGGVASASPFWGVGYSTAMMAGTGGANRTPEVQGLWLLFWIIAYGLVAMALVVATIKTFNRCLGRMDEGPRVIVSGKSEDMLEIA